MPGSHPSIPLFSVAVFVGALVPAVGSASTAPSNPHEPALKAPVCAKPAVEVVAGSETATFPLTRCDGTSIETSVDELSVLGRPAATPRPTERIETLAKIRGAEIAPGVRRFDSRLVQRLQLAVDHFTKEGHVAKIVLVSGYRPKNSGTYHSAGRALDFRIEGVKDEALVAFCKTLPDTGCGYYPNNVFVHMDVREPRTGHVSWVDTSPADPPAHAVGSEPPKDLVRDKKDATRAAKSENADPREKTAEAPADTSTPGLLLAQPLVKNEDKPADGAASALPPLPPEGNHRVKHKHKTRKAHPERKTHDERPARADERFL
ncbi:MAG TPA: DUF882 domain-containing protein [Polyangiaceae bacterium]|nr:DUF882 domain-containing protein [Polyangiaceae bacterium]